ncbi:MAG: Fe-S cluster assembly protein SufD [Crocinitomicaceae bacterium]|nr:Fe-S cluster assembly protein SufD [Crocinitomicaceae bacterium]MBT6029229.1 Fe-S cluster assembly protein SufD [Crocinitomicaceae bacterium]MBT6514864.1 Fe-S cluster assembly protein SufD [Crocinitomicaceae bacterium]
MGEALTKKNRFLSSLTEGNSTHSYAALKELEHLDFPNRKTEDWRYTRVAPLINKLLRQSAVRPETENFYIPQLQSHKIVFSNGNLIKNEVADNNRITIKKLETSDLLLNSQASIDEIFTTINTAYTHGGIYIHLDKNTILEKPIEIIHLIDGQNTFAQIRKLIVLEQGAEAQIVEGYYSSETGLSFTNAVSEIIVKDNAKLHLDKIQFESEEHWHINSEYVYQESNSNFTINTITLNGGTVRNGLNISVDGNNCETNLNGLYLLKGKQHVDNHTKVDHKQPHCTSSELYKGMIDDQATGVFNGKVFVREDAQKIEAFQQNSNILLSENASMNAKPELEIYADDVKCSHGSTTGQFDDEALFYLKSRGISEKNAHALMAAGFAEDVLVNVTNDFIKLHINKLLKERFNWEL